MSRRRPYVEEKGMRVEYINPFVEAAFNVLKEVLQSDVRRGELYLKSTSMPVMGVAAIVGLAGDVEGRVLFDMDKPTALKIASQMNGEDLPNFDDLVKATITELANMITAQAVTKLHDLGFRFDLTPPAIFSGENMEVSDAEVEALIVPMETTQGKIEINVAIRERA
jgi:chemotaxis protein CheX